jgi:predicted small secreted protein
MIMKTIQLLAFSLLSFSLTSCSTVEGMGRDLQSLGKSIEKTAAPSTKIEESKPIEQPSGAVVTPIK